MTREIKTQTCSSSVYLKNVSSPSHGDFDYENSSTEIRVTNSSKIRLPNSSEDELTMTMLSNKWWYTNLPTDFVTYF